MKTNIKILLVSCVIATFTTISISMAQDKNNLDVTLANIILTAKADGESGEGRGPMCYDSKWRAGCKLETGFCSTAAVADCSN